MNESDKTEFLKTLKAVCGMYDKPDPSPGLVSMYFTALNHVPLESVKAGINSHVRDTDQGQFFPKPADILRNLEGNKDTRSEQAWTKVDKAIRSVGPHESVVFDDGLIHAVIDDMGGWVTLCNVSGDEYPFRHNEFIKRYSGFINNPPDNIPRKLIGISEGSNTEQGFKTDMPMMIGNAEQAALVYKNGSDKRRIGLTLMSEEMKNLTKLLGREPIE